MGERREIIHITHTTHNDSLFSQAQLAASPPNMNTQKKKRMAKGKGWLKPPAARPPITSYNIRKGKGQRRMKGQKKEKRGKGEKSCYSFLFHPFSSYFSQLSQNKGPQHCPSLPTPILQAFLKCLIPFKTHQSPPSFAGAMPSESHSRKLENRY